MKLFASIIVIVACIAAYGCTGKEEPPQAIEEARPQHQESKVTEAEAKQLASDYVNSTFAGHVWKTDLGDRKFYDVSPQHWHSMQIKNGRLFLKHGASRGQDFTVSMNIDGTEIKVEHHGYALR